MEQSRRESFGTEQQADRVKQRRTLLGKTTKEDHGALVMLVRYTGVQV